MFINGDTPLCSAGQMCPQDVALQGPAAIKQGTWAVVFYPGTASAQNIYFSLSLPLTNICCCWLMNTGSLFANEVSLSQG
jgi:hypothetical protein